MKRNNPIALLLGMITMLSGCAVNRKLSFENTQAGPGFTPSRSVDIVFQDKRPDVLSGKSKPSLCGHLKSTVQISYNIQTDQGKPLADEFTQSVCASYNKAGATGTALAAAGSADQEALIAAFKKDNKELSTAPMTGW